MVSPNFFIFLVALLLISTQVVGDNPTAIVQPYDGPDPGYIVAESDTGLGNRLRVLAAYMHVGKARFDGAHLVFVWDVNPACPSHFLELFQPIQNVVFATNSSRYVLDKGAKIVYENSNAIFDWTMRMNHIPRNRFGFPTWGQIEYDMYKKYKPTPAVMTKVTAFVKEYNICECTAMHIRLTDLAADMKKKNKQVNVQSYIDYVDSRPADEKIYLMTDNAETQQMFTEKYGPSRILVHNKISSHLRVFDTNALPGASTMSNITSLSEVDDAVGRPRDLPADTRHTTLEHTLIDVLIAAHTKEFKPAIFSSLSDVVKLFHTIGRNEWKWCGN
jgi:hypothetical protein